MAIVTTAAEFRSAITTRDPEIILGDNITLTTYVNITYTLTIKGQTPGLSLFWGNPTPSGRDMLVVSSTANLTLESVILDAQNRDGTLVYVNGGTLVMNDGVIIRNVRSTTSQNGIKIGTLTTPLISGRFIMNGGLVTGIDSADSVFCSSGSVIMNNNAAISENAACGVTVVTPTGGTIRASFTMTGNSRVSDNRSKQAAGGVIVLRADMYMGVEDGDSPEVSGNRPPSGSYCGGILITDNSTLTMRRNAKISGNYSDFAGGGLIAQNALITMRDNSSITDNICEGSYGGGGARIHQDARLILEDNAHISNNTSAANGGGVYLQPGGYLELNGSSQIKANASSGYGGGVFIAQNGRLDLSGNSIIRENTAENGLGIYKMGILNVSQSAQVLDGLFFEDLANADTAYYQTAKISDVEISAEPLEDDSYIALTAVKQDFSLADNEINETNQMTIVLQDAHYTDNVPVITEQLTTQSEIHLEASSYVSPDNVELVVADKGTGYDYLRENDRAAWKLPPDFGTGYRVILSTELNQVLVGHEVYSVKYCHLNSADNPNPDSYSADSEFPIVLKNPGERPGYIFTGWYDCSGQLVTEIPAGTTGDMQLIALWKESKVFSIKYCHLYGANNPNPNFYSIDSKFPIVLQKPGERHGYKFFGWYNCEGQRVTKITDGASGDLLLIALWQGRHRQKIRLNFDGNAPCVTNMPDAVITQPYRIVTIPSEKPKKSHYSFEGWNTCPQGTGKDYYPKDKIAVTDISITLYALWSPFYCGDEDCADNWDKKLHLY